MHASRILARCATLAGLLAAAVPALAQTAQADAVASPHTVTGNLGLFSSYRFRGLDQTFGQPAIQGGIDYTHASGFYAGNWNSNVSSGAGYPEGNLEMDFYGGYKTAWEDFALDVGGLYYYYPGSAGHAVGGNTRRPGQVGTGVVDNGELYVAASWKTLSLKYSHAVTDYFAMPGTRGSGYLDLSASYDLGDGWGLNGHVGHLFMRGFQYAGGGSGSGSYTDWKLGLSKEVGAGWVVGAAYVASNAKDDCAKGEFYCFANSLDNNGGVGGKTKSAGRAGGVLSLGKTF